MRMPLQSAIAPSVIITRRHSAASSATPREGRVKGAAASPSAADPVPRRGAHARRRAPSRTAMIATVTRPSRPRAAPAAPIAAPAAPPRAQPACSEDMMGRPPAVSMCTPWLFMATSIAALAPPSTTSAAAVQQRVQRQHGPVTATTQATPPATATGARPPAGDPPGRRPGTATITASDMQRMDQPDLERREAEALAGSTGSGRPTRR